MKDLIAISCFILIIIYIFFLFSTLMEGFLKTFSILNPIYNYNNWTKFNRFGIAVITIFLNVIFIPFTIIYWMYKLFTAGRDEK